MAIGLSTAIIEIRVIDIASKRLSGIAGTFARFGSQLAQIGLGMAAAFTLPLALIGKAAVDTAIEFDMAMRKIQTITKESDASLKVLSASFVAMSTDIKQTADTPVKLADGYNYLVQAGRSAAEAMTVLKVTTKAAMGGFTDTLTATAAVNQVLQVYGMAAADATKVSDMMFRIVDRGNIKYEQLATELSGVTLTAKLAGVSFEEVGAAIATLTLYGMSGSEAVTALNRVLLTYLNPQEQAKKLAKGYGITLSATTLQTKGLTGAIKELITSGLVKNADALANVFTRQEALRGALGLTTQSAQLYTDSLAYVTNANGATARAADIAAKSFDVQFRSFKNNVNALALALGNVLIPALLDLTTTIKPFIQTFAQLPEKTMRAIVTFGFFAAAIGPVLIGIGLLLAAVGSLLGIIINLGVVLGKVALLGVSFGKLLITLAGLAIANPLIALVVALALLVTAYALDLWGMRTATEKFGVAVQAEFRKLGENIGMSLDFINEKTSAWADRAEADWGAPITAAFQGVGKAVEQADISTSINTFFNKVTKALDQALGGEDFDTKVKTFTTGLKTSLKRGADDINAFFAQWADMIAIGQGMSFWGQALDYIGTTLTQGFQNLGKQVEAVDISTSVNTFGNNLTTALDTAFVNVGTFFDSLSTTLTQKIQGLGQKVAEADIGTSINTFANNLTTKLDTIFADLGTSISTTASTLPEKARQLGANIISGIVTSFTSTKIITTLETTFTNIGTSISTAATTLYGQACQLGSDIVAGIVAGITSSIAQVKITATNIGQTVLDFVRLKLGIRSPSSEMAVLGDDTVAGFIEGMQRALVSGDFGDFGVWLEKLLTGGKGWEGWIADMAAKGIALSDALWDTLEKAAKDAERRMAKIMPTPAMWAAGVGLRAIGVADWLAGVGLGLGVAGKTGEAVREEVGIQVNTDIANDYKNKLIQAAQSASSRISKLLSQGISFSINLGGLPGDLFGGAGGPLAPGAGGPFEPIYRIQDIAASATRGKGIDTDKWMAMYGLTPEQAADIIRQFRSGDWSNIEKYFAADWKEQLQGIAAEQQRGETYQTKLSESLGFGVLTGGKVTFTAADVQPYVTSFKGAIDNAVAALPADTTLAKTMWGLDDELIKKIPAEALPLLVAGINLAVGDKKNAEALAASGAKVWDAVEGGIIDKARKSTALYNAVEAMVANILAGAVPP